MKRRVYNIAAFLCAAGLLLTACDGGTDEREVMLHAPEGVETQDGGETAGPGSTEQAALSVSGNQKPDVPGTEEQAAPAVSDNDVQEQGTADVENPVKVKGIYVTGAMAGTSNMDNLIALVDRTELNTLVIDIKNDDGRVVYEMDTPLVEEIGSVKKLVSDMPALVKKCKEHGIYLIGRIVAFKDPYLAEQRPDLALHDKEGNLFRDNSGLAWVNPYKEEVWEYLLEIAEEAVETGFDEIQFDYIRFATEKGMKNVDFGPEAEGRTKEDVITEFSAFAAQRLHEAGVPVSADVYGVIIDSRLDASNVGQNYYDMAKYLDAISPMVYPSHYGPGNLGLAVPDAQPYETIYRSMSASRRVLAGMARKENAGQAVSGNAVSGNSVPDGAVSGNSALDELPDPRQMEPAQEIRAVVRPWLQDFTATWVDGHIQYGPEEIRAQIQGVYDAGYEEWILWNASNRYTEGGLLPAGAEDEAGTEAAEQ